MSGLFWAIDTILIGYVLATTTFMSFAELAFVAPLVSTFLHDGLFCDLDAYHHDSKR